jgi:type I restriction enzyme S subunit
MSWPTRSLTEVAPINARKPELFDGTRRYYSTGAVGKNGELDTPELVTLAERPSRANCMPKIGDVGFARMNGTQKVVLVSEAELGSLFSTGFCFLEPNDALDPKYLFYFLTSEGFQSEKNVLAGEGIMGGIKNSDVANIQIPLPPLLEQQRIVRLLDEAFEGITVAKANAEKNLQNTRTLFESQVQSVFSLGGERWETKNVGEVCSFKRGLTYAKTDEVALSENVVLRATNIDLATNHLVYGELKYISDAVVVPEDKKVKKDSLIICMASGSKSHLGKVAIIEEDSGYAFGGFMGMLTPSVSLLPKYLFYLMTSGLYRTFINSISDGANINNLTFDKLSLFSLPVPPLSEQKGIVAELDVLEASTGRLAATYAAKLRAVDALQASILSQAFSGALKVAS